MMRLAMALMLMVASAGLGVWAGASLVPAPTSPKLRQLERLETADFVLWDVFWKVQGDPASQVHLCRGPKVDGLILTLTCAVPRGTTAPWASPSSETARPALLSVASTGQRACPEAYVYCHVHSVPATFEGVEPGLDGKVYYKYSHPQDDYPGGKHVILRRCGD